MRKFAEIWPDHEIVQQLVAQLPWGHQTVLIDRLDTRESRLWYVRMAVTYGWSRSVLNHQIDTKLLERQGKASNNFQQTLPVPQSDLAQELLKDPYNLEFLTIDREAKERDLERGLVADIRNFLLELGSGFAFVGRQFHLDVGGEDFYTDLLFYHLKLRCYVVIDLKMRKFEPEFAGKMNFYVSVIDDKLRDKDKDGPTIGLILCRFKNREVVEYALGGMTKPIGVAGYQLPDAVKEVLAVDEIKQHLIDIEIPGDRDDDSGNA